MIPAMRRCTCSTLSTFKIFPLQWDFLHSYTKTDLRATVESVDETSSRYWRKEKVSFQAAYGNERVIANLFLPKNRAPRYQIILFFPANTGLTAKVLDPYELRIVELILRTGRAVIVPAYKGMFERGPSGSDGYLDGELTLHWSKDLRRSIDYLETRSDIDMGKRVAGRRRPLALAVAGRRRMHHVELCRHRVCGRAHSRSSCRRGRRSGLRVRSRRSREDLRDRSRARARRPLPDWSSILSASPSGCWRRSIPTSCSGRAPLI